MRKNRLMMMSVNTDCDDLHMDDHSVICEEKKGKEIKNSKLGRPREKAKE